MGLGNSNRTRTIYCSIKKDPPAEANGKYIVVKKKTADNKVLEEYFDYVEGVLSAIRANKEPLPDGTPSEKLELLFTDPDTGNQILFRPGLFSMLSKDVLQVLSEQEGVNWVYIRPYESTVKETGKTYVHASVRVHQGVPEKNRQGVRTLDGKINEAYKIKIQADRNALPKVIRGKTTIPGTKKEIDYVDSEQHDAYYEGLIPIIENVLLGVGSSNSETDADSNTDDDGVSF